MFSRPIKILFAALLISLVLILKPSFINAAHADDASCKDPTRFNDPNDPALIKCLTDLNHSIQLSINATKPLEGQLGSLQVQLQNIQASLSNLSEKITQKQNDLDAQKQKLVELLAVFNDRVERDYKAGYSSDTLSLIFGSNEKFSDKLYGLITINNNKKVIDDISQQAATLANQTAQLEKEKQQLASYQAQVDQNAKFLDGEITKAKAYQADLSSQIAGLSARQQELIAQRISSLGIPLFASAPGACSSDLTNGKNPGFSPAFGFFTYGVPNRVGLNQYGAWGRSRAGQSSDQILHAYYNFDGYQNMNATIKVNDGDGYDTGNVIWTGSLEDYVKRIYEVPDSWGSQGGMEALKAQAIAARSYVLAETSNGEKSICATQNCQVFQTNPKGGNWDSAVSQTSGQVMVQGGRPIIAWFSSTHGGYIHASGGDIGGGSWTKNGIDTPSGSVSSFSDLQSNAYDKDSPWFYCDWGARPQYDDTAWLEPQEVADIVNVILLAQRDSSTKEHLYQTDKGNPAGTDTWDAGRVRSELQSRGGTPYTSVSSVSVNADFGSGTTTTVTVSGDGGTQSIPGDFFKQYFDLRAPANISITGPLFNVERH